MNKQQENNSLLERFIEALEHPQQISEQEMTEFLADDECRECYEMMVESRESLRFEDANQKSILTESNSDDSANIVPLTPKASHFLRKIAASAAIFLLVCGITFAAIRWQQTRRAAQNTEQTATKESNISQTPQAKPQTSNLKSQTPKGAVRTFVNVPFEEIVNEITTYYNIKAVWQNSETRHLRLYLEWNRAESIETLVATLNQFSKLNVVFEDGKLIIK